MGAPSEYYVDPLNGDDVGGDGLSDATAWQTLQNALDTITRDTTDGDIVHLKDSATETLVAALDFTTYGTPSQTAPFGIRGYTTTAGDGGIGTISGGGSVGIITTAGLNGLHLIDLHLTNTGAQQIFVGGQECRCINVEFDDSSYAVGFGNVVFSNDALCVKCYFHNIADNVSPTSGRFVNCVFKNDGRNPVFMTLPGGTGASYEYCIFDCGGATECVRAVDGTVVDGCVFYGAGGTGKGIRHSAARDGAVVMNSIFEGFSGAGGVGIAFAAGSVVSAYSTNAFFDNETNAQNVFTTFFGSDNESLSSSPFTDAANGDFSTPDVNGNVRGGGFPNAFHANTGGTSFQINKGAAQDAATAAGSGGGLIQSGFPPTC